MKVLNPKHRIIYVIDSFTTPNAGTEGQLITIINGLDEAVFDVHLVVLNDDSSLKTLSLDCTTHSLQGFSVKNPVSWWKLSQLLKSLKLSGLTLIHTFFNDASVVCPPIARMLGVPCIISRRDMGFWYTSAYLWLLKKTNRWVTKAIVNSHAVKEVTHHKENIPLQDIQVIYNGYKSLSNDADLTTIQRAQVAKATGIKLVLVANIRPVKRMQDAVKALSKLVDLDVTLFIAGSGNHSELLALGKRLNVENMLVFLGECRNVPKLLQLMDIGVLCSESEGLSNAILEYQLAKLPVVCSYTGGNIESIESEKDGFHFPVGNWECFSEHLRVLIESDEKRKSFGEAGAVKAAKRYNVDSMLNAHKDLYINLLSGK